MKQVEATWSDSLGLTVVLTTCMPSTTGPTAKPVPKQMRMGTRITNRPFLFGSTSTFQMNFMVVPFFIKLLTITLFTGVPFDSAPFTERVYEFFRHSYETAYSGVFRDREE